MPQNITPNPEPLGIVVVPSTGDPRDSGPIRSAFQKLLNMIAGLAQTVSPAGLVSAYAGDVAPEGWLLCNGQAVSRTDYAALFTAVGTFYGVGNGTTTFNLPDLRGRVVVGTGQGSSLTNRQRGQTGGEETHGLTIQEIPSHSHLAPTSNGNLDGNLEVPGPSTIKGYANVDYENAAPVQNTGGNEPHNNMQPYVVLNYIIRT